MEKCPNCNKSICLNPSVTQIVNFLDLMEESNLFELESSEEYMLMEFILTEDFINRHKKTKDNTIQTSKKVAGRCLQ